VTGIRYPLDILRLKRNIGMAEETKRAETNESRAPHILGLSVILIWAGVFAVLLVRERFKYYLTPSFQPFLILALVILIISFTAKFALSHSHSHDMNKKALFIRIGIILLPIIFLIQGYGKSLGANAFQTRQISGFSGFANIGDRERLLASLEDSGGGEDMNLLELVLSSVRSENLPVNTVGQNLIDDKTPKGYFVLFRFAIACCVADAQPVALLVQYDDLDSISKSSWVRVKGNLAHHDIDGKSTLVIEADSVEVVEEPDQIYIYYTGF